MKKRILAVAIVIIALAASMLSGCSGKPDKTSDGMYAIGLNAIKAADAYIDGESTQGKTKKELGSIAEQAKSEVSALKKKVNEDSLFGTEYSNDEIVSSYITNLSLGVSVRSMSDFIELRNSCAKALGIRSR